MVDFSIFSRVAIKSERTFAASSAASLSAAASLAWSWLEKSSWLVASAGVTWSLSSAKKSSNKSDASISPSSIAFKMPSLPITSLAALIAASLSVIVASLLMSSMVDFSIFSSVAIKSERTLAASTWASLSASSSLAWSSSVNSDTGSAAVLCSLVSAGQSTITSPISKSSSAIAFKRSSLPISSLASLIAASLSVIEASFLMSSITAFSRDARAWTRASVAWETCSLASFLAWSSRAFSSVDNFLLVWASGPVTTALSSAPSGNSAMILSRLSSPDSRVSEIYILPIYSFTASVAASLSSIASLSLISLIACSSSSSKAFINSSLVILAGFVAPGLAGLAFSDPFSVWAPLSPSVPACGCAGTTACSSAFPSSALTTEGCETSTLAPNTAALAKLVKITFFLSIRQSPFYSF